MTEQDVRNIVQQELKQSQYSVAKVPYHVHNGIDSPLLSSSLVNAGGPGATTTIAANDVDTKINISSADFTNGVQYDATNKQFIIATPGQYLIVAFVFYSSAGTANVLYRSIVYHNGSSAFVAYGSVGSGGLSCGITATKIITCSANDTIALYSSTHSASTQSANGYLSLAQV